MRAGDSAIDARHAAWAIVGVAALAAAIFLGYESRGETLGGDEWDYAIRLSSQPLGHALFQPPPDKYLIVVPLLLYKGLFEIFGISSYVPYRVVGIGLVIVSAGLFFLIVRRRVGDLLAVPPTVLLLFFGSASEVVVTSLRIPSQIAIAAGLGMLLALDQRTLRADVLACVLLAVALLSHPESAAFAVAAAVLILFRPSPQRWRRSWVFLAPIALFAVLSALQTNSGGSSPAFDRLDQVPAFIAQSFVAITAAITGASGVINGPPFHDPIGWIVAGLVIGVAVLGLSRRSTSLAPMFWALLAALLTLLVSTGLAPVAFERTPGTPRYLYPEALLLLLLMAELARATRFPRAAAWAITAVLVAALVANFQDVRSSASRLRSSSAQVKAELGAIDLARAHVDPNFVVFTPGIEAVFGIVPTPYTPAGAGGSGSFMRSSEYLRIARDFGTPAYSPAELATLGAIPPRQAADIDLVAGLGLRLQPASARPPASGEHPAAKAVPAGTARPRGSCLDLAPESGVARAAVTLPPGGAWVSDARAPQEHLALSRFAPLATGRLAPPMGSRAAFLEIPTDQSATPWTLWISSPRRVSVCGLPHGGA